MTFLSQRPTTRFAALSQAMILFFIVAIPLSRLAWDQWAQSLVLLGFSFLTILGVGLLFLGRRLDFFQWTSTFRSGLIFWGIVVGSSFISTIISPFPQSAIPGLLNDIPAAVFWCVAVGSGENVRSRYRWAFALAGTLGVVAALVWSGDRHGPWTGPLVNPNVFAALVVLTLPQIVDCAVDSKSRWPVRAVWIGAAVLMVLGLFLSRSLVGLAVFGLQGIVWFHRKGFGRKHFLFFAVPVALVCAGFFLTRTEWGKIVQGDPDRWTWMSTAIKAFWAHPLFGVGPGAFGEAYPIFRTDPWGLNSLYAHNFVLEILVERGMLGGGALLGLIGMCFFRACRHPVNGGLILGTAGFALFNLAHIGFSFPGLYWLFFLGIGLAIGEEGKEPATCSRPKLFGMMGAVFAAVTGVASFGVFRANQLGEKARVAAQNNQGSLALDWTEKGLRWNPWYPPLYEMRAAIRLSKQDWDGAFEDIRKTVALAPSRAGYRMELAELAWERGERDAALREYEKATALLPLKAPAWERWGDLLFTAGRRDEAIRAYSGGLRALQDSRVLGGDADKRGQAARQLEEKRKKAMNGE